jgi:hypothetical protein
LAKIIKKVSDNILRFKSKSEFPSQNFRFFTLADGIMLQPFSRTLRESKDYILFAKKHKFDVFAIFVCVENRL